MIHKFQVGDRVRVIQGGFGIANDFIGRETEVTKLGSYGGDPGVKVRGFSNGAYGDFIGEISFELVERGKISRKERENKLWENKE